MKLAAVTLLLAGRVLAQEAGPTSTPPIDRKIEFKVSLVGKRNEFHLGEIIPIERAERDAACKVSSAFRRVEDSAQARLQ